MGPGRTTEREGGGPPFLLSIACGKFQSSEHPDVDPEAWARDHPTSLLGRVVGAALAQEELL